MDEMAKTEIGPTLIRFRRAIQDKAFDAIRNANSGNPVGPPANPSSSVRVEDLVFWQRAVVKLLGIWRF
jgi:hypothetical protein